MTQGHGCEAVQGTPGEWKLALQNVKLQEGLWWCREGTEKEKKERKYMEKAGVVKSIHAGHEKKIESKKRRKKSARLSAGI